MENTSASNVVMIAELMIHAEKMAEFLNYTVPNLEVSRAYPGNITFDILIDEKNPQSVLFYEVWDSAQAQKAYMTWRVETGDLTRLLSLLAEAPKFRAFRSVAV